MSLINNAAEKKVVEGPMGYRMHEDVARRIEELSKGLPKDFTYRRLAANPDDFRLPQGERSDVSTISTDSVDRQGDVVMPGGIDWSQYNKVVTFAHKYDQLPVGVNQWMKLTPDKRALIAKTIYPTKPADWGDSPWLPSAVLHMMQQPVPTCTGKSIGFMPTNIRGVTSTELSMRPEWAKANQVIDAAEGLEYAVAPIPANAPSEMISVSKTMIHKALAGGEFEALEQLILSPFASLSMEPEQKSVHPSVMGHLPPAHAAKIMAMAKKVNPSDCAGVGMMGCDMLSIHSHIGSDDVEAIRKAIGSQGPLHIKCMKSMHMPSTKSRNTDIVACAVESPDMEKMVQRIKEAVPGMKDMKYNPHIPMAEVKPGMGKDYDGMEDCLGMGCSMNSVHFVGHDGQSHEIPLTGIDQPSTDPKVTGNVDSGLDTNSVIGRDYGVDAVEQYIKENPKIDADDFREFVAKHNRAECLAHQLNDVPLRDVLRLGQQFRTSRPAALKAISVNHSTVGRAVGMVRAGKVNHGPASAPNGGDRKAEDCLAYDTTEPEDSAARNKYPVILGSEVSAHLVANAEARATQQGASEVARAAKKIGDAIKDREKAMKEVIPHMTVEEMARCTDLIEKEELEKAVAVGVKNYLILNTGIDLTK